MKITYQEWLKATYNFGRNPADNAAEEIALRMAKLADLGAEVVELERNKHSLYGYEVSALVKKHFPETNPDNGAIK